MDTGPRPFQIALIAFFLVLMAVGVFLFMTYQAPARPGERIGTVTIWGTLDASVMNQVLSLVKRDNDGFSSVAYVQKDPRTFTDELVNAIAEARSPDALLIPHADLVDLRTKLAPIPYETLSLRAFRDAYIDGAEIYALPDGIYALPVLVDPLTLYYNRDILASNQFAGPPQTWEEVVADVVPTIVVRDFNRNVLLSPIALGEYRNVANAHAILSTLLLQGGSRMVEVSTNRYEVLLNRSVNASIANPFTSALEFYTSFATVNNPLYSWNRAQARDTNAFGAGDLVLYFGMGSEYTNLARLNPNLNFDIAEVPQAAGTTARRTYGEFYGFAFPRGAGNLSGAYEAVTVITSAPAYLEALAAGYDMAPVRRDLIAAGTLDPVDQVRYRSALTARGWLAPARPVTDTILAASVEDVLANRANVAEAVRDATFKLSQELQ